MLYAVIIVFSIFLIFSAGIGLVFYGPSEPISHYLSPLNAKPETQEAMVEAFKSTFMDCGFYTCSIYGIVALVLAYSQFRKDENGIILRNLRPL